MEHEALDGTLEPQDGWYFARCTCGFEFGPLPSAGDVMDVLMEHAQDD